MRVLVIGAGSIGRRHIGNLLALGCEVFVFDLSIAAQEAAFGLGAHPKSLMSHPPDAVVIATPWDQHLREAEHAIERGLPLFVEKPLGTLEELPRWRDLARCEAQGFVTQVGYNWRFHPQARQWAARLPFLKGATAYRLDCDTDMALWPGRCYGNPLLECSHEIDFALSVGASADGARGRWLDYEPGVAIQLGTFGVTLRWARSEARRRFSVTVPCESYRLNRSCLHWGESGDPHEFNCVTISDSVMLDLSYRYELDHFLNAVRTGKQSEPAATLRDGIRVLEVCQRVEQMARATA